MFEKIGETVSDQGIQEWVQRKNENDTLLPVEKKYIIDGITSDC